MVIVNFDERLNRLYWAYSSRYAVDEESLEMDDMEKYLAIASRNDPRTNPNNLPRTRWCGAVFDPTSFTYRSILGNAYDGYIQQEVINSWVRHSDITLGIQELGVASYKDTIESICTNITNSGPLPRSRPEYVLGAARYPLGAIIHGQTLPTGENVQLISSIRRNTKVWMCVRACLRLLWRRLCEEHEACRSVVEGDVEATWQNLRNLVASTEYGLRLRGVTKTIGEENATELLSQILQRWQGAHAQRSILEDLKMVLSGEHASNRMVVDSKTIPRRINSEYLVWGPHLFEKALKREISEKLATNNNEFRVRGSPVNFDCVHDSTIRLRPDIVIESNETQGRILGCIDAKLYREIDRSDTFAFGLKMDVYLSACERLNGNQRHIKGVTFVGLYGESGQADSYPHERGHHMIRCLHLHGKSLTEVQSEFDEKVQEALQFLLQVL
ncbi:hypothetical protein M9435_006990 [Picochlorum sp. BPE23]|nr:hypothetical protein M9435_006990 [Picochlorum sp. BPE23]